MPFTKKQEWALFAVAMGLCIVGLTAAGKILQDSLEKQREEQLEFVETNENSVYVGHFTSSTELRRVDDLDRGISCYQVTYDKGISCVYTGKFTED